MRVSGFLMTMTVLGLAGVVWMIVDLVRLGAGDVPGSTWACGVLGLVLVVSSAYRELGGTPIITENPAYESPAQQFEEQQKRDGLR